MGEKIRQFTAKELERLLSRYGFIQISQKGSHRTGRNLPLGTLRNILTTADIPEHEWRG